MPSEPLESTGTPGWCCHEEAPLGEPIHVWPDEPGHYEHGCPCGPAEHEDAPRVIVHRLLAERGVN